MSQSHRSELYLTVLFVVVSLICGLFASISANILPDWLKDYNKLAWPLFLIFVLIAAWIQIRLHHHKRDYHIKEKDLSQISAPLTTSAKETPESINTQQVGSGENISLSSDHSSSIVYGAGSQHNETTVTVITTLPKNGVPDTKYNKERVLINPTRFFAFVVVIVFIVVVLYFVKHITNEYSASQPSQHKNSGSVNVNIANLKDEGFAEWLDKNPTPIVKLYESDFKKEVIEASSHQPVLLYICDYSWPACEEMKTYIVTISFKYKGKLKVVYIDHFLNLELSDQFGYGYLPILSIYKGGKEVDRMMGSASENGIEEFIVRNCFK